MSVYKLLTNAKVVGVLPPNPSAKAYGPNNPNMPAEAQQFHIVLYGVGNCSATVQHYGSNDDVNWLAYGDPVTVTGVGLGASVTAQGSMTGNSPWHHLGAILTAISGADASVTDTMVAG